jgi:hypothetical protein
MVPPDPRVFPGRKAFKEFKACKVSKETQVLVASRVCKEYRV